MFDYDLLQLISPEDVYLRCESCNRELVEDSYEESRDMLQNLEVQLKPLMDTLERVKDLPVPEFGTLHEWETAKASPHAAYVDLSGVEDKGANIPLKVLPPWMIKKQMNVNEEQHGEVKQESKIEVASVSVELFDNKKKSVYETYGEKNIQDEYLKEYYAALLQRQVGMKSERDIDDDEGESDEDNELEEAPEIQMKPLF